jgi:tRNA(adenine34) deaminase
MKEEDQTHMMAALAEAETALTEGEFPVGCVMSHKGEIIARGRRANSSGPSANEMDHAEVLTLRALLGTDISGINMADITVYSTMEPCLMCFTTLLLNGFRRIVYGFEDVMGGGTDLDLTALHPLYNDIEVEIVPHILRAESLALFKSFFTDPKNSYWQSSLLAKHILEQE